MREFNTHTGLVAPLDEANIDTDQIIPKQFLQKTTRSGFGQHLFHDWRFLDDAGLEPNSNFILNQPPFSKASILLSRENFGCGSSREHAPWALEDFGFRVIIAPSFADIFYANAINNGLLPIRLDTRTIDALFALCTKEPTQITLDLEQCEVIAHENIYSFELAAAHRHNLLNGLDPIGVTLTYQSDIDAYEQRQASWLSTHQTI